MFFFKQKTAYELRISDWSSDVCSSDLPPELLFVNGQTRADFFDLGAHRINHAFIIEIIKNIAHPASQLTAVVFLETARGASGRADAQARSAERRGGKECGSTCRYRWSPYH